MTQQIKLPTEVVRVREHRTDIHLPWVYTKSPPSDQDASEYELEVERLLTHEQASAVIAPLQEEINRKDATIAELEAELSGFRDGMSELIAKEVAILKVGAA